MLSRLFRAGPASMVPSPMPVPIHRSLHRPPTVASLVSLLVRCQPCAQPGRHGHDYTLSCAASRVGDCSADKTEWQLTIPHPKEALR